jgi:alanyl-tRNA synthetase
VHHTGEIGPFVIVQESSVASGIRRIEALTGPKAVEYIQQQREVVRQLEQVLNAKTTELPERIRQLQEQTKELEKQLQALQSGQVLQQIDEMIASAAKVGDIKLIIKEFENQDVELLKQLGDEIRKKAHSTVGFFVNKTDDGKFNIVCAVTDDLISGKKVSAGNLVREAAKIAGGGGGGRPHLATAGARDVSKLPEVYDFLRKTLL